MSTNPDPRVSVEGASLPALPDYEDKEDENTSPGAQDELCATYSPFHTAAGWNSRRTSPDRVLQRKERTLLRKSQMKIP
jgi:hypothetical protein